jgi:hypothetical protein
MRENRSHGMGGEGNGVRERVQRALAGPVAESEKLLADLRDADAETRLSILASGWFRGLAAALEELAIAVDDLRAQPTPETPPGQPPGGQDIETPAQAPPAERPERIDLSDADPEQMIDTARKSREEVRKLRQEGEQARRRLEP